MPMIGRRFYPGLRRGAMGFMQSGDFPVPVLHLKFGKNTGAVAYDSSPEGNDGTIRGASWVKGYLGPGLSFDGLDDYVEVPNDPSIEITGEVTIITKIKVSGALEDYPMAFIKSPVNENLMIFINEKLGEDKGTIQFRDYDGTIHKSIEATGLSLETWYEVAGVYDGTQGHIYVDAVLKKSLTYTPNRTLGQPLYFGGHSTGYSWYGLIDEITLFDVGLTATQLRQWNLGYR